MLIQITGLKVLRDVLRNNELIVRDFNVDLSYLNNDNQWEGLFWFVQRLDSNSNFYKVESHMILTKAIFLMSVYDVAIGFDRDNQSVVLNMSDDNTYFIKWHRPEDLLRILWVVLEMSSFSPEKSYAYEDFRQATRLITDHLDEYHDPRDTWVRILKLSSEYFGGFDALV
ncbi:hypothetical protein [Acinetobacter phage AbTZA1]|uniref:Uncharacterized protein n=1 Tax=Acinetobacter phage AbTZA1 TaxID=2500827 RepID=A0A3T0IGV8_9CAUD|nr:hypothetical protein HYP74_gp115 [Acinetobacter phage AbTZA1]AZU98628.1 hypothetical protein [Acinetobacter phage AbTZA1]